MVVVSVTAQQLRIDESEGMVNISPKKERTFLEENERVAFRRQSGGYVWISDIEHVIDEKTGQVYLADAEKPYYLCGDTIPGGTFFELFPYHYYDKEEEEILGGRINYRLIIKNVELNPVTITIEGMGTTTSWEHYKTWEGALKGEKGQKVFSLAPGEILTLWEEHDLKGGVPWSGIILGRADGDIKVYDYAYLGEKDPGIEHAEQMPDLALPDYLLASFTRGTSDWNTGIITLFPGSRGTDNHISLAQVQDGIYSFAVGYSPGGPLNNLCTYNAVEPTFTMDTLEVEDPVSGKSHLFFGGNYPIMYQCSLPMKNDTQATKTISLYICSNDRFNVDTIAGVWIKGKMLHRRVPVFKTEKHWRVFTLELQPGEKYELPFTLIPLGSRWGGMIASLAFSTAAEGEARD